MGQLISGLIPLATSRRRVGPAFGGQPVPEPFLFEILGLVWPAMGVGPEPKVPTMPLFSYRGGKPSPAGKKSKVDHRIIGNSLLLMSLNFQREFYNFYSIALDVVGPPGSILRYRNGYKRRERAMKFVISLAIQVFLVKKGIRLIMKALWRRD